LFVIDDGATSLLLSIYDSVADFVAIRTDTAVLYRSLGSCNTIVRLLYIVMGEPTAVVVEDD
jgi:hypothetical protein